MVELLASCKAEELVKVELTDMLVVLKTPPFNITCDANVAAVDDGFNLISPLRIVVVPEYVLAALRNVQVPEPSLERSRFPAITVEILPPEAPPKVMAVVPLTSVPVMAIVPTSPTMLEAVAKVIGPLYVAATPLFNKAPPVETPVPFRERPSVDPKVKPFRSRAAPEVTDVPLVVVPNGVFVFVPVAPSLRIPELIVVAPVYVLFPDKVNVPAPSLVIPYAPLIIPLIVRSLAEVPSSPTLKDLKVEIERPHDINALLVPLLESKTVTSPDIAKVNDPVREDPVEAPPYMVRVMHCSALVSVTVCPAVIIT